MSHHFDRDNHRLGVSVNNTEGKERIDNVGVESTL